MNDNELADRTHRTAEAWEKTVDGRANDERLIVSGYQAHDTAQTLRAAAARLRELSTENERLRAFAQEQGLAISDVRRMYGAGVGWPARAEHCWNEMQGGPMGDLLYPDNP